MYAYLAIPGREHYACCVDLSRHDMVDNSIALPTTSSGPASAVVEPDIAPSSIVLELNIAVECITNNIQ